jgi:hypothetical protein
MHTKRCFSSTLYLPALLLILGAIVLSACSPQSAGAPVITQVAPSPAPGAKLTLDALKNAEYQSEFPASGKARLTDGRYEEEIAPGADATLSKLVITLGDQVACGDLDGNGVDDAAAILAANSGGSGVFVYLVAVINDRGTPRHVASAALGDRVQIKSISIQSGEIGLSMITHGPNDPMCCPTQEVTRTFRLEGNELKPVSD